MSFRSLRWQDPEEVASLEGGPASPCARDEAGRSSGVGIEKEAGASKSGRRGDVELIRGETPIITGDTWKEEEEEKEENPEDFEEFFPCTHSPSENRAVNIQPETVLDPQGGYNMYRFNCTKVGSFRCCITDLIFDVRAPVTLTYYFDSWSKYLNEEIRKQCDIAGPLLNIQADAKEAVAAVHFPHFLCLKGEDCPEIYLAHFVEDGMSLEKPDWVGLYHVELKNPAFSPRGAVFKTWFQRKIKVHAMALLYQDLGVQSMKLHFYLLPNDSSLRKAVHDLELNCASQRIWKPPETMKALKIGSRFSLREMPDVTVCPEYLEFKYLPADMEQQYLELHSKAMKDELSIFLTEKDTDELVWRAIMRKEDLHSTVSPPIEEVPAPVLMGHQKGVILRDHVLDILENLKEEDFRRFKRKLNEFPVRKPYKNIPKGQLEKADTHELVDLLCGYYTESYAVEVAARVLEEINIKDQAEKLWKSIGMPPYLPKNT
nr:PREDICTED: caspase recruitment domain-containing protein 8 [Anolis carolinensis]|eukprot:XP_003223867.2 PREDICTED: caspase recruitment domain-containing protein 8 [Anolis carolinensis]